MIRMMFSTNLVESKSLVLKYNVTQYVDTTDNWQFMHVTFIYDISNFIYKWD